MNFKPTLWKTIISIVVGLGLGLLSSRVYYFGPVGPPFAFSWYSLIGFVVGFIVIYIIWSLFDRGKK